MLIFRSDEQRRISHIDTQYVEDIQRKVSEVFGEKSMLKVYEQIEKMLEDEKMVHLSIFIVVMFIPSFLEYCALKGAMHWHSPHRGF